MHACLHAGVVGTVVGDLIAQVSTHQFALQRARTHMMRAAAGAYAHQHQHENEEGLLPHEAAAATRRKGKGEGSTRPAGSP